LDNLQNIHFARMADPAFKRARVMREQQRRGSTSIALWALRRNLTGCAF
jgi:hypothetical protein